MKRATSETKTKHAKRTVGTRAANTLDAVGGNPIPAATRSRALAVVESLQLFPYRERTLAPEVLADLRWEQAEELTEVALFLEQSRVDAERQLARVRDICALRESTPIAEDHLPARSLATMAARHEANIAECDEQLRKLAPIVGVSPRGELSEKRIMTRRSKLPAEIFQALRTLVDNAPYSVIAKELSRGLAGTVSSRREHVRYDKKKRDAHHAELRSLADRRAHAARDTCAETDLDTLEGIANAVRREFLGPFLVGKN